MQLTQVFTVFLAATLASATPVGESQFTKRPCDSGGKAWGDNQAHAIDRAQRWCSGSGGSGTYNGGQRKTGCYNAQYGNNKYQFEIRRTAGNSASLTTNECNAFMRQQIYNCKNGGEGARGGYFFRADVVTGHC